MRVGASAAPSRILGREVGISPSRIIPPTDSVEGINIGRRNLTRLEDHATGRTRGGGGGRGVAGWDAVRWGGVVVVVVVWW